MYVCNVHVCVHACMYIRLCMYMYYALRIICYALYTIVHMNKCMYILCLYVVRSMKCKYAAESHSTLSISNKTADDHWNPTIHGDFGDTHVIAMQSIKASAMYDYDHSVAPQVEKRLTAYIQTDWLISLCSLQRKVAFRNRLTFPVNR